MTDALAVANEDDPLAPEGKKMLASQLPAPEAVSYTHLDVYKRQDEILAGGFGATRS